MNFMIQGITVKLLQQTQTGTDPFGAPIYTEKEVSVDNVLVAPSSVDDINTALDMWGKKAVYTLGLPKGDTHTWQDQKVKFFGATWRVIGLPMQGIEANVPTKWHVKWLVERYE